MRTWSERPSSKAPGNTATEKVPTKLRLIRWPQSTLPTNGYTPSRSSLYCLFVAGGRVIKNAAERPFGTTLVGGYAAGRVSVSGRCGVAVPGGDGALLEVDAKGAGHAGISSDRRVQPNRDRPALILHILRAHG